MRPPDIAYLTNIYFDFGAALLTAESLRELGVARPLLVTDKWLIQSGASARLQVRFAAIFDEVQTNPAESEVLACLRLYRATGCDGLVALGGGSPIDLAKAVALLATHDGPLLQYTVQNGGAQKIRPLLPPLIAIPTTAGSGAEVGRAALITLTDGTKSGILSPHLIPRAAICDPELTLSLPPSLTAATGMDAISHCIETFCSPRLNPVADAIALDGLERGYRAIETATAQPGNRDARRDMMLCALQGALAFQKGLGAVHSLSHPLGGLPGKRLHHGTLNAIFLPHVLEFNAAAIAAAAIDERLRAISHRLGLLHQDIPAAFDRLNSRLNLPRTLGELGVKADDLEACVDHAMKDHCTATNPRLLDAASVRALYHRAL